MWVARDRDGKVWLYFKIKPTKGRDVWMNGVGGDYCEVSDTFPIVKWEDREPTPVEYDHNNTLIIKD